MCEFDKPFRLDVLFARVADGKHPLQELEDPLVFTRMCSRSRVGVRTVTCHRC